MFGFVFAIVCLLSLASSQAQDTQEFVITDGPDVNSEFVITEDVAAPAPVPTPAPAQAKVETHTETVVVEDAAVCAPQSSCAPQSASGGAYYSHESTTVVQGYGAGPVRRVFGGIRPLRRVFGWRPFRGGLFRRGGCG